MSNHIARHCAEGRKWQKILVTLPWPLRARHPGSFLGRPRLRSTRGEEEAAGTGALRDESSMMLHEEEEDWTAWEDIAAAGVVGVEGGGTAGQEVVRPQMCFTNEV